jgi:hypothetical protein
MKLILKKIDFMGIDCTLSNLSVIKDSNIICRMFALEPVNCIPAGVYVISMKMMISKNVEHYELSAVPGHTGIFIHSGNSTADTKGCILVGCRYERHGSHIILLNSVAAVKMLQEDLMFAPSSIVIMR